ncbi:MAG: hypothetical protein V4722_15075 [Bacteroidota bacterium]
MKKLLALCFLLTVSFASFSNSAMPGIWEAGANGKFVPLFAGDSVFFGKIQMQHEQILVNLYPGFAVVKGEYYMYNNTDTAISMHVAYPKQATFSDTLVQHVIPSYIAGMKVLVNDETTPLMRKEDADFKTMLTSSEAGQVAHDNANAYENWFVWKMTFAPKTITKITVYFLTDNSHAHLRRGYSGDDGSAFSYVLESGRAWGGRIDSGKICVQLKEGLTTKDIKAVLPYNTLIGDTTHLLYQFTNKEPTEKDNLLIWYKDVPKDSAFEKKIFPEAAKYYAEIDGFDVAAFSSASFTPLQLNDFEIHSTNPLTWVLYGALAFGALVLFMIIYGVVRWIKRSNRANQR